MPRIPVLAGTRVHALEVPPGAVVLTPPATGSGVADVGAAVRDALRFPLAGEPLEALVPRGGRVTIVVEPAALPIPGVAARPAPGRHRGRRRPSSARLGVPSSRQTILVAAGLARRPGRDELEALVTPEFARRFDGRVAVHDAAGEDLVAGAALRPAPASTARSSTPTPS